MNIRNLPKWSYVGVHFLVGVVAIWLPVVIASHPSWETTTVSAALIGAFNWLEKVTA